MATDIKKFLDQAGVSTLWSRVAEEVAKVDAKAVKNAEDIAVHAGDIATMKGQIAALEAGTYDDTELRGLIGDNASAIADNVAAIAILNGDAATAGSVANTANAAAAAKVAEIVANADANFDTLKEIADWILNDTTGAADMANDIAALQGLVGDKAVAEQIADAISAEGLDKYALAADLTALANRVKALEDADGFDEEKIDLYTKEISEIPKVSAVKFIRGRTYGSNIFLDVVVEMSPDLSVFESHAATEDIEETLKEKYDVFDIDVHVEPAILADEERDASIALVILGLEEQVLNNRNSSLLAETFTEIRADGSVIDKAQKGLEHHEHLAIADYKPDRISKKTIVLTYHYFEHDQTFAVTSIWRRRTQWYCEARQLTQKS